MSFLSSRQTLFNSDAEIDLIENLKKIPFIPLSDGTYSSVNEGTIWLQSDALSAGFDGRHGLEAFPNLFAKLQTVNPALLSTSTVDTSCLDVSLVGNLTNLLHRIGVQWLSAHEIVKVHILPAVSDDGITNMDKNLINKSMFALL